MTIKLLFLSGSARQNSLNKKLAKLAAQTAGQHEQVEAEFIDLAEYEMPIYNGDWEDTHGLPEATKRLKEKFIQCDGFFISNPEYNSSITPLLKNTIDWMSRQENEEEPILVAFSGKACALAAASPSAREQARVLEPVRMLLGNIRVQLASQEMTLPKAHEAFDDQGDLRDQAHKAQLEALLSELIDKASN